LPELSICDSQPTSTPFAKSAALTAMKPDNVIIIKINNAFFMAPVSLF
jgi:hypothetical protein